LDPHILSLKFWAYSTSQISKNDFEAEMLSRLLWYATNEPLSLFDSSLLSPILILLSYLLLLRLWQSLYLLSLLFCCTRVLGLWFFFNRLLLLLLYLPSLLLLDLFKCSLAAEILAYLSFSRYFTYFVIQVV
jgi:hypothetical protein